MVMHGELIHNLGFFKISIRPGTLVAQPKNILQKNLLRGSRTKKNCPSDNSLKPSLT
jgi:hypothetical protein